MILEYRNRDIRSGRKPGEALTFVLFLLLGRGETAASEFDDGTGEDNRHESS